MSLLGLVSGAVEAFGFDDLVGGFIDNITGSLGFNLGGLTDVFSGAITNAAVAGISGGDIGKAALFGAAGGGLEGFGGFNYANELGAGIKGYGLDKATGGSGLAGALAGAGGEFLKNRSASGTPGSTGSTTQPTSGVPNQNTAQNGQTVPQGQTASGKFSLSNGLKQGGILSTLAGNEKFMEAALGGVAGASNQKMKEELLEKEAEYVEERDRRLLELRQKEEQDRIAFFTAKQRPTISRSN